MRYEAEEDNKLLIGSKGHDETDSRDEGKWENRKIGEMGAYSDT